MAAYGDGRAAGGRIGRTLADLDREARAAVRDAARALERRSGRTVNVPGGTWLALTGVFVLGLWLGSILRRRR